VKASLSVIEVSMTKETKNKTRCFRPHAHVSTHVTLCVTRHMYLSQMRHLTHHKCLSFPLWSA